MIKTGIKYTHKLDMEVARNNNFNIFEVDYQDVDCINDRYHNSINIDGIYISLEKLDSDIFMNVMNKARTNNSRYVVISTIGCDEINKLYEIADKNKDIIKEYAIDIYIENNYIVKNDRYLYGHFSDSTDLNSVVEYLNDITATSLFGVCIDVGYANIIGINIRSLIEGVSSNLKLMHMNDNDGEHVQFQMPYTFTTGRGTLSTDWFRIIGSLVRMNYKGKIVFNTIGTFERTPVELHAAMFGLLKAMEKEWDEQFEFEDKLKRAKHIILFGAGKMAQNYMEEWGSRYKPAFFADNNKDNWGEIRMGVEVKSPDEIKNIPEQDRLVLICNLFYDAIGEQLDGMGVGYGCYWDHYYL